MAETLQAARFTRARPRKGTAITLLLKQKPKRTQEFYQVAFRKRVFEGIDELQRELDTGIKFYNTERTHQGKMCCGRPPFETLIDGKTAWAEKCLS